jgi:hypothetical protein
MKNSLELLADLANELDLQECHKLADTITKTMVKIADHEVSMVHSQLQKTKDAIETIMSSLHSENEDLPAWVQSMISVSADDLDQVAHYMKTASKNEGKKLNKPFRTPGGPKKFSVYVKNDKGNIVKVNFGDPKMRIKDNIPGRRKNFRARHNCDNPGSKTKARYWSCRQWSDSKSDI